MLSTLSASARLAMGKEAASEALHKKARSRNYGTPGCSIKAGKADLARVAAEGPVRHSSMVSGAPRAIGKA